MELTSYLENWINQKLLKYAEQIGISRYQMPIPVLSREELAQVPAHITWNYTADKVKTNKGITYWGHDHNLISFINVKRHRTMHDLEDTIVHELVHIRFQSLAHGPRYQKRVDEIMEGKAFKPYKQIGRAHV